MKRKRLTEREISVLKWIEMQANATVQEIAKSVRVKEHSARRIVDSLLEQKLIQRYVHLNVYPLGFFEVDLFVVLSDRTAARIEDFIQWCIEQDNVCFLAETVGRFHLKIGLTVKSPFDVGNFIEAASKKFNYPFAQKFVASVVELFDFGIHKSEKPSKDSIFRFGLSKTKCVLTQLDHEILKLLSRHPALSASDGARRLGVSLSTFMYRIQRLETCDVINGYRYLFDPFGKTTEFFHGLVSTGGVTQGLRREIFEFCRIHPKIPFFAELSGNFDFFFCMAVERSIDTLSVARDFKNAVARHVSSIDVEVYGSPTLRKLVKYPFDHLPRDDD